MKKNKSLIIFLLIRIIKIENKKIDDAIACTRKYLIEDSDENELFFELIKGINDNRLISSPIHVPNHDWDEIVIVVPIIKVVINIIL